MSLDRINPELGYIPGNIQVLSTKANVLKNNASINELITFAKNVLKIYKDPKLLSIETIKELI